jgi:hypothetical protein
MEIINKKIVKKSLLYFDIFNIEEVRRAVRMITKVSRVYPIDFQKHDNPQSRDGMKKKQQEEFKDVLAKMLGNSPIKPVGFKG